MTDTQQASDEEMTPREIEIDDAFNEYWKPNSHAYMAVHASRDAWFAAVEWARCNPAPHAAAPGPSGPSFTGTIAAGAPAQAALRAYAASSKGMRCPICSGLEGCDHTVRERLLTDLHVGVAAALAEQIEADARIAEGLVHPMNDGPNMTARQIATAIREQEKKG